MDLVASVTRFVRSDQGDQGHERSKIMEFKISEDGTEVTITGMNGTFTQRELSDLCYRFEQAKHELKTARATIRVRDTYIPAGMAWLDERYPDHVQRVDLDALDLKSTKCCVLAQASGRAYPDAVELHKLWGAASDLGFIVYDLPDHVATELWRDAYRARMSDQKPAS
jgi:hypothetical protein